MYIKEIPEFYYDRFFECIGDEGKERRLDNNSEKNSSDGTNLFGESEKKEDQKSNYVIVGNGFDLNLGLKSSYNNFLEETIRQYRLYDNNLLYEFNNLFIKEFDGKELNWSDFETIFENQIIEINKSYMQSNSDYTNNFRVDKINRNLRELEKLFYHYIKKEYENWTENRKNKKSKINRFYKELFSNKDTHILSFNFTNALKDVLKENGITNSNNYQLHGSLKDNNIIFGGGFTGSEGLKNVNLNDSLTNDKLVRMKNDPTLFSNRQRLIQNLKANKNESFNLFIMGHSIIGSDFIFLKPFFEKAHKIYLFYHEKDYSTKLQYFIKQLGREQAEKIYLIPFFNVLQKQEDLVVIDGLENYNLVKDNFTFSIPQDKESSLIFENVQIDSHSFIVYKLRQISINGKIELENLLKVLEQFEQEYTVEFQPNFAIHIQEVKDSKALSKLFANRVFKNSLKYANRIEILNSTFEWKALYNIIDINKLEECIMKNNNIIFDESNSQFDISKLPEMKNLQIENNEFQDDANELNVKSIFEITIEHSLANMYRLIVIYNNNLTVNQKIMDIGIESTIIKIQIDSSTANVHFPKVEHLEMYGIDDISLPSITINNKISVLKVNDFADEELKLSMFFQKENNLLSKLQEIEINNMFLNTLEVDIFCDIFNYSPILRYNTDKIYFSKIISESNKNAKELNILDLIVERSEPFRSSSKTNEEKNKAIKNIIIMDEQISEFVDEWGINKEKLNFFLENYQLKKEINMQNGYQELRRKEYFHNSSKSKNMNYLEYSNAFKNELKLLVEKVRDN